MVQEEPFHGLASEDPIEHLEKFLEVCALINTNQVTPEYVRMHLFRSSLAGKAKAWLNGLPHNSLRTWGDVTKAFFKKFIPEWKTAEMRRQISTFLQEEEETLYEAWERFRGLLRACPHHQLPSALVMRLFYDGLDPISRANLDAGCGGQLAKVPLDRVEETIEEVVKNYSWGGSRRRGQSSRSVKPESETTLQLQAQVDTLNKKLAKLTSQGQGSAPSRANVFSCEICGGTNHDTSYCGGIEPEHIHAIGMRNDWNGPRGDPSFNNQGRGSYGWNQGPPNRNWGSNSGHGGNNDYGNSGFNNFQHGYGANQYNNRAQERYMPPNQRQGAQRPTQFQPQQASVPRQSDAPQDSSSNAILEMLQQIQAEQKEQKAHTKMLETQLAQLAEQTSKETRGAPKAPQPSNVHQVNMIELRPEESEDELVGVINDEKEPVFEKATVSKDIVSSGLEERFAEFYEVVQELHAKMPFLEEILAERKKVEENVAQVSCKSGEHIEKSTPKNCNDPGSFCIPVAIKGLGTVGALADLGASVNLMPLSVAMKLDTPMLPSTKAVQLVDGSVHYLSGELEVPMQIGNAYVSCNFVVMDIKEDPKAPLILGREALRSMGAIIDCRANAIFLEAGDERIAFEFASDLGANMMVERIYTMSCLENVVGRRNDVVACTPGQDTSGLISGDKHEAKTIPRLPPEKLPGLAPEAKSFLAHPVHIEKCSNDGGTEMMSIDGKGVFCGARSPRKKKKKGGKRGRAILKGLGANPRGKEVKPPFGREEDEFWESNQLYEVVKACLAPIPPTPEFVDALKRR